MKKTALKLLAVLLSVTLVTGCRMKTNKSTSNSGDQSTIPLVPTYHYGDSDDNSNNSSNSGNENSNPQPADGIDGVIAAFVDGLDVSVPLLNEYGLDYEVYYYYAEQMYVISGAVADVENIIEAEYLAEFTAETGLVSANDDTNYPVDEYGYLFSDAEANVVVNFYYDEGAFYFSIYRTDDLTGQLDVSDIDTNWYVDYINFEGYSLSEHFPATEISVGLDLGEFEVTGITENEYPYYYEPSYVDTENDETYPAFIYLVLEGDQMQDYLDILEASGYSVRLSTQSYQTYDDNWDIVTVEYQQGTAYDADKNVYITMYLNSEGNTLVQYLNFQENYGDTGLTTNTDWTDEEKALMNSALGEVLPFMQFGEDYSLYKADDDEYDYLILEDSYFENLTGDYGILLKAAGYEYDDETYYYPCYFKDNGTAYIEIFLDYEQGTGHYFEIYYEDSKITTVIVENGTHVLNQAFFGLPGNSNYNDYSVVTSDGTTYKAQCASGTGIQIRSKNSNSGIVGQNVNAHCVSIKVSFNPTANSDPNNNRVLEIYASNSSFNIADMYGSGPTKVGSLTYITNNSGTYVQTYTFSSNYSYIGIRSSSGAIYLDYIEIIWG